MTVSFVGAAGFQSFKANDKFRIPIHGTKGGTKVNNRHRKFRILCLGVAAVWLAVSASALLATPQEGPNLALNKTVTASSSFDLTSFSPEMAVDGVRAEQPGVRGWSSQGDTSVNHTEWIMIDLGTNYPINRVDLYPRNDSRRVGESFPIDFTIQTSLDGNSWTTVVTRNNYEKPGPEAQVFTFNRTNARFVIVVGTNLRYLGAEGAYYMQFTEIEVYGPSAPDRETTPPTGSSTWSGDIVLDQGGTQQLTLEIRDDNQIAGEIVQSRAGRELARHTVQGSLNPQTGVINLRFSTRVQSSSTQGRLTGRLDSRTEASGQISIQTTFRGQASTQNGTWRITRSRGEDRRRLRRLASRVPGC